MRMVPLSPGSTASMDVDDAELTVVQYARLHGISIDHLAEPLPDLRVIGLQKTIPDNLTDDTHLPQIEPSIYTSVQETLTADRGCAELLQGARNGLTTPEELEAIISTLFDTQQTSKLRLESPLLQTDHEADFRKFAGWESSHFKDGCLPWEPLNDELDVGLQWPKMMKALPGNIFKELESEKFEIQKSTFYYLQSTIKDDWTSEDERIMWETNMLYKRNMALEPVTPPLLPQTPELLPYIPSSPGCHLPLLSDPASLISEDLQRAEKAIFEQDSLINQLQHSSPPVTSPTECLSNSYVKPLDTFLLADSHEGEGEFSVSSYVKAEDRKVEEPLMPLTPVPGMPKTVTFNDVVEEMLLGDLSVVDHLESPVSAFEEAYTFLQDTLGDMATNASRKIEQEQLQEEDANSRVQVPIMDFSLPDPPWKFAPSRESSHSVLEVQKAMIASVQKQYSIPATWPGVRSVSSKLRWTVFPSELAKVALEEFCTDDELLRKFLVPLVNDLILDSSSMTWKPPGFRILFEIANDDDDELEFGIFTTEQTQDVAILARKRKLHFEGQSPHINNTADMLNSNIWEANASHEMGSNNHIGNDMIQSRKINDQSNSGFHRISALMEHKPAYDRSKHTNPLLDSHFSPSDALNNFLEIRASKKQKSTQSAHFTDAPSTDRNSKFESMDHQKQPTPPVKVKDILKLLPSPSVNPNRTPTAYIISSPMLKRRSLIRTIQQLYSVAIPIERDFSAHNRTAWMPNSVTRSPISSSLDSEADFIISPSTGVILTTLQKIKQKPLPGQKGNSAFRTRVERVGVRYERLVVLVSEASEDESTSGLAESDTAALAEATGFCSSLEGTTRLHFVGGGEETLAKWLVATMVQYGSHGDSIVPLLEEETLWELFLRRAGMNAYAAQVVIAELKAPDGVNSENESEGCFFGIIAFVEMSQDQRIARFERLLGGRRILQSVGRVLDATWP